jgi:membrane-bound lytic murein transglycosylase A
MSASAHAPEKALIRFSGRCSALYTAMLALASCAPTIVPPARPVPPPVVVPPPRIAVPTPTPTPGPANAAAAGVRPGPAIAGLILSGPAAASALSAFKLSCPSLLKRADTSGLAEPGAWAPACAAAAFWRGNDARAFFTTHFETAIVGEGNAFATGYFEPQIAGSRVPGPGYPVPVYRVPPDLVQAVPPGSPPDAKPQRGRWQDGALVLYHDRAAIEAGALAGRGLELAWAADAIDLFFLQIQGSGRLALPDGSVMRIGYAGQNGREYVGIGKLMKDRGLLGPGQTSMQGIVAWLRANPEAGRAIMNENKSYVFFHELTGPGPLGALGLPVTPRTTVAADPKFVPLGAPVFLRTDHPEVGGIWVAQDTGGAIRGANRFDTFWGAGEEAKRIAGGMQAQGEAILLLPKGSVARLERNNGASARR